MLNGYAEHVNGKIKASKKISTVKSNYPWRYDSDRFNKRLNPRIHKKSARHYHSEGKIEAINPF